MWDILTLCSTLLRTLNCESSILQDLQSSEPQFSEQIDKMESLSTSFSPHLSEADKILLQGQIETRVGSHKQHKAALERQVDALQADIDEVC